MTISSVTDFKDAEVTTRIVNQNNNLHYYSDFSSLFLYNNRRSIMKNLLIGLYKNETNVEDDII